ncbi:MAG: hypothetical protein LBT09_01545 [Planctomycetaceae bacterium]|jgi:hypothetical protein|nr:hypothetical protein [Planctomycetaceae bacterium]
MKKINGTIILLLVILAWSGCLTRPGYQTTDLEGTVKIDNIPVTDGAMSLSALHGSGGTGVRTIIADGKYRAKNVPVGKVYVTFTAVKKTGKRIQAMGIEVDEQISIIPPKYKEGTEIEISSGQKKYDFNLTSTAIPIPSNP